MLLSGGDYDGDEFLLLWEPRVLQHFRAVDPPPYSDVTSCSTSSVAPAWAVPEAASWQDVEALLSDYFVFCLEVSSVMGEAHNAWELIADEKGLDCHWTEELVGM